MIFYSQIDFEYLKKNILRLDILCADDDGSNRIENVGRYGNDAATAAAILHKMNIEINLWVFKLYKMYQCEKAGAVMWTFDDNTRINAL